LEAVIFIAAWVAAMGSWFLAIFESIGMWKFHRWAFTTGIVALSDDRVLPNPRGRLPLNEVVETANGKFLLTGPNECFFRSKFHWFSFHVQTPFPLKGSIQWSSGNARICGRLPIFTVLFMAAWVVGWTAGSIMAVGSGNDRGPGGVPAVAFGLGVAGGMFAISLPIERRRAKALVAELEGILGVPV
jgi:hypothetical protein